MKTLPRADDLLFQVERQIARRADELDRELGVNPGHALDHWRQAEQEVWSRAAEKSWSTAVAEKSANA